jgi:hypothetical protein
MDVAFILDKYFKGLPTMMKQAKLWMLAAILICGASVFTACTSNDDNPPITEESLVGLWYEELEYNGVLEDTGEAFTSVVLAMQVNEDHTGCLYSGAFNEGDYDNPIVVYGGPEEAGFTWRLTSSGQFIMTATDSGESVVLSHIHGDGTNDELRQLTSADGWEAENVNGQTVISRGSDVLTPANAEETAIIENMANGESFTLATLNADGMPKQIVFINVNTEGPGEEYSPAIARYMLNKKFDIILTQENFNYNAALTAPFDSAGYLHDIWGGGIDVGLALERLAKGEDLEGIFHIDGLTAFWSPKLQVVREDSVRWTAGYGLFDHGWDMMVRKGFRSYDVTLSGGNHVVVYNMHMDASSEDDEEKGDDGPDRRARMVQWRQLRDHILAHLDNRPVIVTGDLNSYYERDSICSQVFDVIERTGRATVGDAWITLERGGKFPAMMEAPVTNDPGSTTWALKGQTLDKIIYINPTGGPQLKPLSFSVDSATYVRPDGKTPLGDHAPVSAKFRFLPR